ncbi:MAG TPA: hypothetical protein VF820_02100 [Patescibacteria group bacterium]
MLYTWKYFKSYLDYQLKSLAVGRKVIQKEKTLCTIELKNKKLAKELEDEANKIGGYLTYGRFLHIIQFGKHGYHMYHNFYGMTDTCKRWGKPLATLAKENNITQILEFGFGDGALGVEIVKKAKKLGLDLTWHGVEIVDDLLEDARKLFKKNHLENNLGQLSTSLEKINLKEKVLFVCSFSFDSIPPLVFTNTTNSVNTPNAIVGVQIKDGFLSEVILPNAFLEKHSISLKKGIYNHQGTRFDLSSWKLFPNQFVFLPTYALSYLKEASKILPAFSKLVIIDEFETSPISFETTHLCMPKDLGKFGPNRRYKEITDLYKNAGSDLLYYSSYIPTYAAALSQLGFTDISYDGEYKTVSKIIKQNYINQGVEACFVLMATKNQKITKEIIPVLSPIKAS